MDGLQPRFRNGYGITQTQFLILQDHAGLQKK
jgi:hypothetical protein